DGNDTAEVLGQGEADAARHPSAAGKAAQVGLVGIDAVVLADVVEGIEHNAGALTDGAIVAGAIGRTKEIAVIFADLLPGLPAAGIIARRDKQHHRPGFFLGVFGRYVKLVVLLGRIVVTGKLGILGAEAGAGKLPIQAGRFGDAHFRL